MGKQEGESRWLAHSKSSTVLLDPAAVVENWKRQIQGKDGIPLQQQRLIFKVANQEEEEGVPERPKESICGGSEKGFAATDLIQDLQTWKALLRCNDVIVGKLENPIVEAESEQSALYCQVAQELRNIGIPCDAFYLFFDKWIPATRQPGAPRDIASKGNKTPIKLSIEIDKFSSYRIDLVGHLEGRGKALVFEYRLNGGEFHTQLSLLQQTVQYRQGQQLRQSGQRSQNRKNGVAGRDAECADHNGQTHALCLTPDHHQTHFGKDLEFFPVVCSETSQLTSLVLTVITLPVDNGRRLEQLVQPSPFLQDCEGRSDAADAAKDSGLFLPSSRLTHVDRTDKGHSSHRTQLEKSLKHRLFASLTAELAADTSLPLLNEQQPSASLSQDPVSSSCTACTVDTEIVCEAGESDKGPPGKQSKKKKKKKGKKKPTKLVVQNGAHKAAVLPVEGLAAVDPKSPTCPCADVKMYQASPPVHRATLHNFLEKDQASNSGKSANVNKKGRIKALSIDQNDPGIERASEIASCPQEICLDVGEKPPMQSSPVAGCEQEGVSSGSDLESRGSRFSLPSGAKRPSELLDSDFILDRTSSQMGCMKSNDKLRDISQNRNGRPKTEKALYYGLKKAATYCLDSGRLAPVKFLKDVYTTTGRYERGSSTLNRTVLGSCQTDPAAARDLMSDNRKNPGNPAVLDSPSVRAVHTLQQSNNKGDVDSSSGQGRTSEERRGASSNYTRASSQSSGQCTKQGGGMSGSGSGGENDNRGDGGGRSNVSGGGGWSDCENETNGNKERRNTMDAEDRRIQYSSVASESGDWLSGMLKMTGNHFSMKNVSGSNLGHKVRRIPPGDALQNGSSGSGYGATTHIVLNPAICKEKKCVWKPKLNFHEGNVGMDPVLWPTATSGSVCEVPPKTSSERAYSNGIAVAEGSMSKESAAGSLDENLRREDNYTVPSIQKPVLTNGPVSKIGQDQSMRELNLVQKATEYPQFLQQTPSIDESQGPFALPTYGTRSAALTSYSHSGEANAYDDRESLVFHQEPVSGPASHARCHLNGVASSGGHFADSRLHQEDTSYRWKAGKRAPFDHERRLPEKSGVDKERAVSTATVRKWVPVDKGSTNPQIGSGSTELRPGVETQCPDPSSSHNAGNEAERVITSRATTQSKTATCVEIEEEANLVSHKVASSSKSDVSGNGGFMLSEVLHQAPTKALDLPQPAPVEAVVGRKNGAVISVSALAVTVEKSHSLDSSYPLLANCEVDLSSGRAVAPEGSDEKSEGVSPSHHRSGDRLDPSTAARPSHLEELDMIMESECKSEAVDATTQQLTLLVTNTVQYSSKWRKASEGVAVLSGAPLAEFERVLCAATPTIDPVSQESKDALGLPSTLCDCSMARGGRNYGQGCFCQVAHVPLSAIWQWYEKPSNYGAEVQLLDTLRKESGTETYLAYFVPYLSGIQLYGYKGRRCRQREWVGHGQPMSGMVKPRDANQGGHEDCGASLHLLFEFFEGDPPPHRQPLFQKIQDLLQGGASSSGQSSGDAFCLHSTLLGDLHPASWFAVAWYPIYRISDGPLRSVFLTYHSLHHVIPNNSLRCSLGQSAGPSDGRIAFPVVGLECYNTQSESWLSLGASAESASSTEGSQDKSATNPAQTLKQRLHSLQVAAATMARKLPSKSKHLDYEFFVSRRR